MTTAAPSTADVLEKVDTLGPPGTPVTTPEVAEEFDCTQRTIYNRLDALVEEGAIETKKVGANSRVWWRPVDGDLRRNGGASDHRDPVSLRDGQTPSFCSDSEMAEHIREFDWAETPLGPMTEWPPELRVAIDIMLGADEALGIYWGEDLTLLYNDAWRELIGEKHPAALGRPARAVFPEIWETIGPMFEDVLNGNGAAYEQEQRLPLERDGSLEDAWFDYSVNPIPMADGSAGGIFNVAIEVTERKETEENLRESEERQSYLVELNDALRPLTDPAAIQEEACRVLGEYLGVSGAQYTELDLERNVTVNTRDHYRDEHAHDELPSHVGEHDLDAFPAHAEAWRAGRSMAVDDVEHDAALSDGERAGLLAQEIRAALTTPLVKNGEAVVAMAALSSVPREWTDEDIALLEETADRTWNAVQRAQAEQALADELEAVKRLQEISTRSVQRDDENVLYDAILDTAVDMLDADFGSLQRLDPDRNDLEILTNRGFNEEAESVWGRVAPEHASTCGKALKTGERVVVPDVEASEFMAGTADQQTYLQTGIQAVQTTPLISRDGNVLGMLSTHWADPHEPSERDLHLLDVLARQVADLMQQQSTIEALRESEERYRTLFESVDEGFCIVEVLYDEESEASDEASEGSGGAADSGDPVDCRFLETNPAFEEQSGLTDAKGKLVGEIASDIEDHWFETYGRVARTGEPERFQEHSEHLGGRWFDVYCFRIGDPEEQTVAILFDDITEQKHREERQEFLLRFSDALRAQPDAESIEEKAVEMVAEHLDVDRCWIAKVDEEEGVARIGPEQISSEMDPMVGTQRLSNSAEVMRRLATQTIQLPNLPEDPRFSDQEKELHAGQNIVALLSVPLRNGEEDIIWALTGTMAEPREWTDNERILLEEAAERTWEAVERTRAEQALSRSNQSLERLNDVSRELIDADLETISDRVPELTVDILDVDYAALWQYDEQTGNLELTAEHVVPGTGFDAVRPGDVSQEQVWETFVGNEIDVENAFDVADGDPWPAALGSRVFVPLGRHGVVCVGSVDTDTFEDRLLDLVEMVASTVETAWDRADSEAELAQRNEELTRLDRLNTLIRGIDQALVGADSRAAIDEAVCEQLSNSELYGSAWLATYDAETDTVRPEAWAGIDSRYLEDRTVTVGDESSDDPLVAAHQTRKLQIVADIATDPRAAPWREAALARGARSCIVIPLVYEESLYGVLTVYGQTPQPDERETEVLAELGGTIAHAVQAVEATTTRGTHSIVELTLRAEEATTPLARLAREANCEITVEGLIRSATDDALTVFFTAADVSPDDLAAAGAAVLAIADLTHLDDRDDGGLYRAHLSDGHLGSLLSTRDAVVRSASIDGGSVTVVVDLPETGVVSEFLDDLRGELPNVELLARTTRSRPLQTQYSLRMALEDRLTARQLEVLRMAYESGFFESPRVQTGTDLSEALDVSQSTFTYHLRESQRRLCELVFEPA
jgi:PAS domain S-box-containing protein